MAKLTAEQKEFYSSMETTFNTQGWGLMASRWKEEQDALRDRMFFGAKSMDDVVEIRIQYGILGELVSLPTLIESQKQAVLDKDE